MVVAVSGINGTDNPAPGLGVAKSLCENHTIIGLSYDPNEAGNYLPNLIEKSYLMPYPAAGFDVLEQRLIEIKEKSGIELIIPCLDAELPLYIKYQPQIEALGIKLFLPDAANFELRNKNKLDKISQEMGIFYPKTYEVSSLDALYKQLNQMTYPIMVKGNYYKAYQAYNLDSAIDYFIKISNEWGFPILLQEVVYGEEINLVGVGDGNGELKGAVSIKKLTTTDIGKIWTGVTIANERLMKVAESFVSFTQWRGPFEIECIANEQHVFLIEINPRFPAWLYFATAVGINLPQMIVDMVSGKEVVRNVNFPSGKLYIRYTEEIISDFSNFSTLLSKKEAHHETVSKTDY